MYNYKVNHMANLAGSDYTAVNQTVVLNGQTSSIDIPINILSDNATEGEESFTVNLYTSDSSVTVHPNIITIRIADNDSKCYNKVICITVNIQESQLDF